MEGWLKQSGATGLDDLELADFSDTGRGIRTRRHFEKGEKILTITHDVLWTVKHAYDDPFLGPALLSTQPPLSVDDTLATYLLFVRSRGSGYDGPRSHVAAMPTNYTSTIFFAEAELEVCAGSSLYTTTKQLDQQIEADYEELVVRLFGRDQEIFPRDKFTIEDYKWALCTVWSRAMDFKLPNGDSIRLLAPFADMLNHSSEVERCHTYDVSSGNLYVLAGKGYEPGDQVFINYGPVPNNRLLRLYGFVLPGNPNDSYDLVLATHPLAPLFEQKRKLLISAGLNSTCTVCLTRADPLPNSVIRYLRIQRLDKPDLAAMGPHPVNAAVEKISDENEVEILQFLVDSISSLLDSFGTPMGKLEEQLAEGFFTPGGNAWSAAHVSLGEQRVLQLAKKAAEDLLAAVGSGSGNKAQCAKCQKVPAQLMWCGRCNGAAYCGRACQVAHFKEHKAICERN
ncbi:SET domain-containing protein [Aaosphaeria arxii CBS 175.79]|uniref:SET domain-containing protein n=1 Tax=Aaosphaeria arxii CBS 175.79 TaxID=1450172 RepID=A0A6A5XC86_9PLEO|nr:SET domain-containing protein [Aaosphaeria arxii CBS 175.79]KAF2010578.1 SET domain-containing protein [Aaosphaeria arxii CBS 175.79]